MDSYTNIIAISKVKKLLNQGKKAEAGKLADSIDYSKVKNVIDLNIIAEAYVQAKEYESARNVYSRIYELTSSKKALSQLVYISIKLKDITMSEAYLATFDMLVADDTQSLIFHYKLESLKGASMDVLIGMLEKLKSEDYTERWAKELATLYHKNGDIEKCINECNDMILWFGEGDYVEWAKALKGHHLGQVDVSRMQAEIRTRSLGHEVCEALGVDPDAEHENADNDDMFTGCADAYEVMPEDKTDKSEAAQDSNADADAMSDSKAADEDADVKIFERKMVKYLDSTSYKNGEATDEIDVADEDEAAGERKLTGEVETLDKNEAGSENERADETAAEVETFDEEDTVKPSAIVEQKVADMNRSLKFDSHLSAGCRASEKLSEQSLSFEDAFGNYANLTTVRKQLIRMLEILFDSHKRGFNIIITGGSGAGKTSLAKRLARMMYKIGEIKSARVAIVSGDKFNRININEIKEKLIDSSLIIEQAGLLSTASIKNLISINAELSGRIVVVLEDTRDEINMLLRNNPDLNSIYNNRIHLPNAYNVTELCGFAYDYFLEHEYEINLDADEYLKSEITRISIRRKHDAVEAVIRMATEVVIQAEKRTAKTLLELAAKGKFDEGYNTVICLEDFVDIRL